jgi:FAD/FMN-containing dehydrogenase
MERVDRRSFVARAGGLAATGAGLALGRPSHVGAATSLPLAELARDVHTVIVPADPGYDAARRSWNARFDGIRPAAIVVPATPAEVKAVLRWARKHGVRMALRSGGHSYAGLSSTSGVVVDLSRFSGIALRPDGTARIGAGAKLGNVYRALWPSRRSIATGSHPTVGLGGLALGGGQGFVSRAHGLTSDNVVAVDIVTADGRLRRCSASAQADLFWALRGGGAGSYGIVTAFTIRTFAVERATTFNVEWPWAAAEQAVGAWQAFMRTAPDAVSSVIALRVPQTVGGSPKVAVNGQMLAGRSETVAALAPLTSVGSPVGVNVVERPYDVAVKYFEGGGVARARLVAKSAFARQPLSPAGIHELIVAVEAKHRDPRLRGGGVVLFAYGGAIGRVPPAATSFVHRDALFSLEYVALWNQSSVNVEDASKGWVRDAHAALRPHVSAEAVQNYADLDLAGWKRAYYGQNLPRLASIKRRYDPGNVFRHALSIPTKL